MGWELYGDYEDVKWAEFNAGNTTFAINDLSALDPEAKAQTGGGSVAFAVENLDGPIASSDVATIRGISQAGTTVKVAGRRMKTNVFRAKLRLRPGRNLIPVSFDDGKGNVKTLYREIEYRIPK